MSSSSRSRRSRGTGTDPSGASSRTKPSTISSKDPAFEQAIIDAGYYPEGYDEIEPGNMEEIMERLGRPRPSLSPSSYPREKFLDFKRANTAATTEIFEVFSEIRGKTVVPSGRNYPFKHLEPLAEGISAAQPDYFIGSQPAELHPSLRNDVDPDGLHRYIIPSNFTSRPILPNHFTELKGPTGDAAVMKLQITQDLAVGARGMLEMQSYGQDAPTYDGNAYTLGATYHSGTASLEIYAMHPTEPAQPGGAPQYHTTQVRSFAMRDTPERFREGATWYRNSMDLSKEYRDTAIARANEIARSGYGEASDPSLGAPHEPQSQGTSTEDEVYFTSHSTQDSETSIDEPALDTSLSRKRSSRSRPNRPRKRNTATSNAEGSTASES